jgi:branched-chain amino acid transport system substrate-binding protein
MKNRKVNMNKNTKRVLAVAGATAVVLGTVTSAAFSAPKSVTLVFQGPLTGASAQTGQDELLGAKTAVLMYNAANPAVKVNLITADDQGDPSVAGTVAPGVASNKAVIGVVGPAFSGASVASFPSYKAAKLTVVSPSATRVTLTDPKSSDSGFPIFHRVLATDALQGPALVRWAIKGVTSPKIYVIDDQSSYGTGLRDLVNASISSKGLSKVGSDSVAQGTADYSSTSAKVIASGANVVIYCGYYADAGALAKSLNDKGFTGQFAGGDGVLDSGFIKAAGATAAEGVKFTAGSLPFELAANDAQKAAFTKATGLATAAGHTYVTETFNATNVFLQCISQGHTTRPGIQACVSTGKFPTVGGGTISFTRQGEVSGGAPISGFQVVGGAIKYDGPQ